MSEIKTVGKSMRVLLSGFWGSKKSLMILVLSLVFGIYAYLPVTRIALYYNSTFPPCAFAFYLKHYMMSLFQGGLMVLLFSDVLAIDEFTYWHLIRAGRRGFILGQCAFILLVSFIYTLFLYLVSLLLTFPVLHGFSDWGSFCWQMTQNSMQMAQNAGISGLSFGFNITVINHLSPMSALLYSILFLWLTTSFAGAVVLTFTIWIHRKAGLIAGGILTFMTLFVLFAGIRVFGSRIRWFSPLSWSSIASLDWEMTGQAPSPTGALIILISGILIMFILSGIRFLRKDLE